MRNFKQGIIPLKSLAVTLTAQRGSSDMVQRQYNTEMEEILRRLERDGALPSIAEKKGDSLRFDGRKPSLLLHSCCGPCSSAVLERLLPHFAVTVFFYNPNILPGQEYEKRLSEQRRLLREMGDAAALLEGSYEPKRFLSFVRGLENEPEGGKRCERCFALRMEETALACRRGGYDLFTTTLTVSPHKNAPLINTIGENIAEKYGMTWLPGDFKKKEGYKRSIALCKQYDVYRQNYCGCKYSIWEEE